jgi:hypothetical protein
VTWEGFIGNKAPEVCRVFEGISNTGSSNFMMIISVLFAIVIVVWFIFYYIPNYISRGIDVVGQKV